MADTTMTDPEHDLSEFGGVENTTTDLRWEADFTPSADWQIERQESGLVEFVDGRLHIDCRAEGGVTVWTPQGFPGDLLVEYTATVHEPDERASSRNLNCFFCAADPDDPLEDAPRSGEYNEYHTFPNYVFTLTRTHSRLRRDPGFEQVGEFMLGAQPDTEYTVRIRKQDGRIVTSVDNHWIHDWTDDDPHGSGWVGLRTYDTDVTYDDWTVSAVE